MIEVRQAVPDDASALARIDLARLPPPDVVETIDYEAVLSSMKADLMARAPELAPVLALESEPLVKLLEVAAWREMVLRGPDGQTVVLDGDGRILRVPAMPKCSLEGKKALASYPVRELADCVFVYFASVEKPEALELPTPPELADPEWTGFLCYSHWACNYRYALDNLADPMHGC